MNNFSALLFLSVIFTGVYSAPLSSEEEVINQLLAFREDLLADKLLNYNEANQQGMASTSSYSLPPYSLSLHGKGKTSQQREFSEDMLLMVRDLLRMEKARLSTYNDADLQEIRFQQMFSKILGQTLKAQNGLWPRTKSRKDSYTSRGHVPTNAGKTKMASTAESSLQSQNPTQGSRIMDNFFTCLVNNTLNHAESLKRSKQFGTLTSYLLDALQKLGAENDLKPYFKTFIDLVFSRPKSVSEKLVVREQQINWHFCSNIVKDTFKKYAVEAPIEDNNEPFRQFLNLIRIVLNGSKKNTKFLDLGNLNPEDESSLNSTINFFLNRYVFKLIDGMEVSEEVKDVMKKKIKDAVKIVLPALFNRETSSPENRNRFLRSLITLLSSINIGIMNDSSLFNFVEDFLANNPTNEELNTKVQCLVVFFMRKGLEKALNIFIRDQDSIDEFNIMQCGLNSLKEGFQIILSQFPEQLSDAGGCEGFDMKTGSWAATQQKKGKQPDARFNALPWVRWG